MKESSSSKGRKGPAKAAPPAPNQPVSLKQLAAHLGLNAATVSVVLNDVPGRSIPQTTRDRIKAAAREMNYQPSLLARSLRNKRTLTIGVLIPQLGDGYHAQVMSGIGDELINSGYFYFTAHHGHRKDLIEEYTRIFIGRGAQGILAVDTALDHPVSVPVVAISGHRHIDGVTNVVLDHRCAAKLALDHLYSQGHRSIAFMRGQPFSSDADDRWNQFAAAARKLGLTIDPNLVVALDRNVTSPEVGYPVVQQLRASGKPFTAVVAFNDIYAMGAIRALLDLNLRVPEDVSVIGFDDIHAAAYTMPRLTTIRQPLEEMGRTAVRTLLDRINGAASSPEEIAVTPELIVRDSTGPAPRLK